MFTRLAYSLAAVAALVLAGIGSRASSSAQVSPAPALVKTAPAQILVNAQGMTLYLYTPDKQNKSVCTGDCAKYWPPVLVPRGMKIAAALAAVSGTFGLTTRSDGKRQLTYDGAPLYTFVGDKRPGDMTGQGAQRGTWWVVVVRAAPATAGNRGAGGTPTAAATPTAGAAVTPTPGTGNGYGY